MTLKRPASENQKPPRYSLRLGLWAVLLIVCVSLWWQRAAFMQWSLMQLLQQVSLLQPSLSGAWIDFNQARVASLQFKLQTVDGPLAVQLAGVKLQYDLRNAQITSIKAETAHLHFVLLASEKPASASQVEQTIPVLPFQHITVKQLQLEVETPSGLVRFAGQLNADYDPANQLLVTLADQEQVITLEMRPSFDSGTLTIRQTSGSKILDLQLERRSQSQLQLTLSADASTFLQWLTSNSLMPTQLSSEISRSTVIQTKPNIAGMMIGLTAQSVDNLAHLKGRLMLTRDKGYLASAEIALNTLKSQLDVDGHLDLSAAEFMALLKPWLPQLLNTWRYPSGNVMGTIRLKWQPNKPLNGAVYLKAHRLDLIAGPVKLQDGYLRLDVKDFARLMMALEMDVPSLKVGKDTQLNHLQLKAQLKDRTLTLEQASMPTFGGMLEIMPDSVNIDQRPLLLTLGVRSLDLAQLLDSLNTPQLSGTGTISGKLPLRLTEDSVEVYEGNLKATRPGVLRYQGPMSSDENLALSALRNMLYHSLQAKLNYRPNGDYQMGLRLEGKNPKVLSGHPVAFNLNLSGHLPDLLQKGIMAGDFEKPILEQVRSAGQH